MFYMYASDNDLCGGFSSEWRLFYTPAVGLFVGGGIRTKPAAAPSETVLNLFLPDKRAPDHTQKRSRLTLVKSLLSLLCYKPCSPIEEEHVDTTIVAETQPSSSA